MTQSQTSFVVILSKLLRPIARFCLNRGLKFQDFIEAGKHAFVTSAQEILTESKESSNTSRLAVACGLQRRDVNRVLEQEVPLVSPVPSLLTAVIGRWSTDTRYSYKGKKPKPLIFEGAQSEFAQLVQSITQDINPYTVLFELERIGAIKKEGGLVELCVEIFYPKKDVERGLDLLAQDLGDLVASVEDNVFLEQDAPNLHIATSYNNVCLEFVPEIRRWFLDQGAKFHQTARNYLSKLDKDTNSKLQLKKGGARVMIGTFSRTSNKLLFLLCSLIAFPSCGGGSAGTGTRDLSGRVILTDNSSPAGVRIAVVETGDQITVGEDGSFSVKAPQDSGTLSITRNGVSTLASVPQGQAEGDAGQVFEVLINPVSNNVDLRGLDVTAKIEGVCDIYFENKRTIKQANTAPQGVLCPLRVRARRSGVAVGGVPFSLEYRDSKEKNPWKMVVSGTTSSVTGLGEVIFPFYDDSSHCLYRVVAPTPYKEGSSVVHEIITKTKQRK